MVVLSCNRRLCVLMFTNLHYTVWFLQLVLCFVLVFKHATFLDFFGFVGRIITATLPEETLSQSREPQKYGEQSKYPVNSFGKIT